MKQWQIITDEAMANLLAGLQFDIGEEKFGKLNNRQNFPIQFFPRMVCILPRGDSSISNLILPYMAVGYFSRVSMDPNHLLYKAEKPSVRLSVCLRHGIISVVSAWIDLGLGLCIAESFET